jgi:hypothetical protein
MACAVANASKPLLICFQVTGLYCNESANHCLLIGVRLALTISVYALTNHASQFRLMRL